MSRAPFLFELSGEHPTLPRAEVIACLEAEGAEHQISAEGPGYFVAAIDPKRIEDVARRLALTHRLGPYLGSATKDSLKDFLGSVELPDGSISVRAKRFGGSGSPEVSRDLAEAAAGALAIGRKVDLTSADLRVRILISDEFQFYLEERTIDRTQYDERHVRSRPYFSPISLHPRYARALVNLTRVRKGQTLLDPFCGTGGVLLEAALIGAKALGSDLSQEMLDGCGMNLEHFHTKAQRLERVDVGDILETFGKVDAVATDPPYGRSASTMKEPMLDLHTRAVESIRTALNPGGRAAIVLPWNCTSSFVVEEHHEQRVHRSLTRHYCLLR
jgi:tRNA (guanine10-N2)-dimethyltransferase